MSLIEHSPAHATRRATATTLPRFTLLKALFVWSQAWREYQQIQRLDAERLRDVGMTEADRAAITVSHIVARMRG